MSEQQIANYLTAELTARARVDALRARVHSDEIRLAQTQVVAPMPAPSAPAPPHWAVWYKPAMSCFA